MHDLNNQPLGELFPNTEDELKKLSLLKPVSGLQDSASIVHPVIQKLKQQAIADALNELELESGLYRVDRCQDSVHVQTAHDTCEISAIYMQRHKHHSALSLGHWFVLAHGLQDNELKDSITALCAKRIIVRKGYNRLSLHTLERFNSGEF